MFEYFERIFSKYQFGCRKGFSKVFLAMLEKWRRSVDRGHVFGTDLSTASGCDYNELLIAKLNAEAAGRGVQ